MAWYGSVRDWGVSGGGDGIAPRHLLNRVHAHSVRTEDHHVGLHGGQDRTGAPKLRRTIGLCLFPSRVYWAR